MTHRPWLDAAAPHEQPTTDVLGQAIANFVPTNGHEPAGQERRASPRRPHRVFQWIAPCIDGRLPDQSMFYQVNCIDISRTGMAFYVYEELPSEEVIIAIGTTADAVYVRSRVTNCARVEDSEGLRYRIGCEFVERIEKKPQTSPSPSPNGKKPA